jgi:uncharacterized UPF0146 family protein
MTILEKQYQINCETPSDINEHLPVLKSYYDKCDSICEIGVRGAISLSAALASSASRVIAIDIMNVAVPECDKLKFICGSSLDISFGSVDALMIDSLHTYPQLKKELELHAHNVRKYILMHDTGFWGENGENGEKGLNFAIREFLATNNEWDYELVLENNNGLTILKRVKMNVDYETRYCSICDQGFSIYPEYKEGSFLCERCFKSENE